MKEDGFFFFLMFFSKWSIKILLNEHEISRLVFEVSMKDSEFRFFLASNYFVLFTPRINYLEHVPKVQKINKIKLWRFKRDYRCLCCWQNQI